MVRCADGSLYTGWTCDLYKRIEAHNSGRAAKYTRSRLPVRLVASWESPDRSQAMRLERFIKTLSKTTKESLIASGVHPYRSISGMESDVLSICDK